MEFKKQDLIETISKNRDEHQRIFDEAVRGYKDQLVKELEAHIERIKRGEVIRVYISFPQPENHTRDYDRILKMLEMTPLEQVELGETQFSQYVLDDWNWKRAFLSTNATYSSSAATALESLDDPTY